MEKTLSIQNNNPIQTLLLEPSLQIGTIKKPISIIKGKELYKNLIMEKIKPPTSIEITMGELISFYGKL